MPTSAQHSLVAQLFRVEAECNYAAIRDAYQDVYGFLQTNGLTQAELDAWELVLAEAGNNSVKHTTPAALDRPVKFEVCCASAWVEVRITDHTPGFDWPDQTSLPDDDSEHGRGLFIIQSIMDRVEYLRGRDTNCLVLRKARQPSKLAPAALDCAALQQQLGEREMELQAMTEEISSAYESLATIFRLTAELSKVQTTHEFAQRVLNELRTITDSTAYVLRLKDMATARLQVFAVSLDGWQAESLALSTNAAPMHSVEVGAALKRQDVWFDFENRLAAEDPLQSLCHDSTGFAHPIFLNDVLVGVLTLSRIGTQPFKAGEVNIVHTFADFLAIHIVNSRLQEEQVRSRLVARELEIATSIQRALLPRSLPQPAGFSVAGYCESARQVGGDFYDALPFGDHGLLLVIADVMGKGIPAAMFAAIFRSMVRTLPELTTRPSAFMSWINERLYHELSGVDMFITAQLVFIDTKARKVRIASAGHCPLFFLSDENARVRESAPDGMPLGVMQDSAYAEAEVPLERGMRLLLFTDGLPEARNSAGEFWGVEPLQNWFSSLQNMACTAEELKGSLTHELAAFQSGADLSDDQTFIVFAENSSPPPLICHNES